MVPPARLVQLVFSVSLVHPDSLDDQAQPDLWKLEQPVQLRPQGFQAGGLTGSYKPVGITGTTGLMGSTGLTGPTGPAVLTGQTGATGSMGPIGITGLIG